MMTSSSDNPTPDASGKRRRRVRYAGTHPRRFDERYKELNPQAHPEIQQHIREQGRTPAGTHVAIMVREVMDRLAVAGAKAVADCTLGYGGHAEEFIRCIAAAQPGKAVVPSSPRPILVGMDVDGNQLGRTRTRLEDIAQRESPGVGLVFVRSNFAGLPKAMGLAGLDGFDAIFADLGVSSMQIDDPSRGFSYKADGPLDMRMDERVNQSAAEILATISQEELSAALAELADEPDHEAIAAAIVARRQGRPIRTTLELVEAIMQAKAHRAQDRTARSTGGQSGQHSRKLHASALTFQALRMMVNDELGSLRQFLRVAPFCLRPGGRIGIISFHSGEDRLIKQAFRQGVRDGVYDSACDEVIRPSAQELRDNPRSSPAKLRWARRAAT
jgi:16S rRNA (cytosine1402-N4)-methyltransferase